jgi:zinc protease
VFVGDMTLAKATALARQHFGTWAGGSAAPVVIPPPTPAAPGHIYLVDRQDAAQTVVQQFLPAPRRDTRDYYSLLLADAVWGGGGFGTRLNLNLREDKGYSYGVFSTLALLREAGSWFAGGGVQTDKTAESVAEFKKELDALAGTRPISADEFANAKNVMSRGYAQRFESYSRIAGQIADLWALGLPMAELQREFDETTKANLGATLAAAKEYARPDRASIVVVGDRAKIEARLRGLQAGDVVVVDSEGRAVAGTAASGQTGGRPR